VVTRLHQNRRTIPAQPDCLLGISDRPQDACSDDSAQGLCLIQAQPEVESNSRGAKAALTAWQFGKQGPPGGNAGITARNRTVIQSWSITARTNREQQFRNATEFEFRNFGRAG
jgi:hypothetical protein